MFDFDNEKEETKFVVSDKLIEIYKNFIVSDQIEEINKLSEKERYLLLIICVDKHDDSNVIARYNYKPFKKEIQEIYEVQDNRETTVSALLELIKETNHNHIESDCIVDSNGNKLPEPFDKNEVRDKKIDLIKK